MSSTCVFVIVPQRSTVRDLFKEPPESLTWEGEEATRGYSVKHAG